MNPAIWNQNGIDSGAESPESESIFSTMDFKPSVSVLFGHYSLPWRPILTKLERTKFEKTTYFLLIWSLKKKNEIKGTCH